MGSGMFYCCWVGSVDFNFLDSFCGGIYSTQGQGNPKLAARPSRGITTSRYNLHVSSFVS